MSSSASAFESGTDELGVYARVRVDPKVYSEYAILKTAYWFTDQYYLFISKSLDGDFSVEFRNKTGDSLDALKAACGEFWNGVLDQEVRQKVLQETASVRDTLVKKAFFEAKSPTPDCIISDESHLVI